MTYLFIWNPRRFDWKHHDETYNDVRAKIKKYGKCPWNWSTGSTKRITTGDRIFLMRVGVPDRGIVASAYATSDVYEEGHWVDRLELGSQNFDAYIRREEMHITRYVDLEFDKVTDIDHGVMLPRDFLQTMAPGYNWSPMGSGVSIPEDIAAKLETAWAEVNDSNVTVRYIKPQTIVVPQNNAKRFIEQTQKEIKSHQMDAGFVMPPISIGMRVKHAKYGEGIITQITFDSARMEVAFVGGNKTFNIEKDNSLNAFRKGFVELV